LPDRGEAVLIGHVVCNDWLMAGTASAFGCDVPNMMIRPCPALHLDQAKCHPAIDVGAWAFLDVKWRDSMSQFSQTLSPRSSALLVPAEGSLSYIEIARCTMTPTANGLANPLSHSSHRTTQLLKDSMPAFEASAGW
jgi:hypothetical protein